MNSSNAEEVLFAVVTITLNDSEGLFSTRRSLDKQVYRNWIHIIVDGKSENHHIIKIRDACKNKSVIVSEEDSGIYHAMNKGWKLAPEQSFVIFLNSGDELVDEYSLMKSAESILSNPSHRLFFGYFEQINPDGSGWICKLIGQPSIHNQLYAYGYLCHQSTIMHRSLIEEIGGFDTNYKIAADWDCIVKGMLKMNPVKIPHSISRFYTGGISTQQIHVAHDELALIRKKFISKSISTIVLEIIWRFIYLRKVYRGRKEMSNWNSFLYAAIFPRIKKSLGYCVKIVQRTKNWCLTRTDHMMLLADRYFVLRQMNILCGYLIRIFYTSIFKTKDLLNIFGIRLKTLFRPSWLNRGPKFPLEPRFRLWLMKRLGVKSVYELLD